MVAKTGQRLIVINVGKAPHSVDQTRFVCVLRAAAVKPSKWLQGSKVTSYRSRGMPGRLVLLLRLRALLILLAVGHITFNCGMSSYDCALPTVVATGGYFKDRWTPPGV